MEQGVIYNTNNMRGEELRQAKAVAYTHEENVLSFFVNRVDDKAGASTVYNFLVGTGKISALVPITSIRRAISTLVKKKQLVRTDEMKMGIYGKQEHLYRLA